MVSPAVQEFAYGLPVDSGMLRASVTTGGPVDQAEILSLAAMAQALFITATIESRRSGRGDVCHQLWGEVAQLFEALVGVWAGVESADPAIDWLRGRFTHFASMARDRVELYQVTERERCTHAANRDADFETAFSARHGIESADCPGGQNA